MRMRFTQIALMLMTAVLITGCPKRPTTMPNANQGAAADGASTSQFDGANSASGQALGADQAALAELQRIGVVIYFDYDKSDIKSEYVSVVAAHAKFLNGGAKRKVRLEGHTDERGSREYNIGLGERRAQAVRRALLLQGVREDQITTVSYGEERPALAGSDEAAYAKNRRVELVYGQ
jgi:peptidoglycan-associated lipoprotein